MACVNDFFFCWVKSEIELNPYCVGLTRELTNFIKKQANERKKINIAEDAQAVSPPHADL